MSQPDCLADHRRRDLSRRQRAEREIPQRSLPSLGLVDGVDAVVRRPLARGTCSWTSTEAAPGLRSRPWREASAARPPPAQAPARWPFDAGQL